MKILLGVTLISIYSIILCEKTWKIVKFIFSHGNLMECEQKLHQNVNECLAVRQQGGPPIPQQLSHKGIIFEIIRTS